jgi:hypothetical protein
MASSIINNNVNTNSTTNIKSAAEANKQYAEVKSKVTIPMYFYNVIVPQLGSYYDLYPVNFDVKPVVCCPLHDEDTPSCRYYPDTNSFYCFGCQKGGDVIWLHRYFVEKINGELPSKESAIDFLYNFFVKGKELQNYLPDTAVKDERLNSDQAIVKLNIYRYNLEQSISFDTTLSLDVKKILWNELDIVDILLSENKIIADDAIRYLKNKVKETLTADNTRDTSKKIVYNKVH